MEKIDTMVQSALNAYRLAAKDKTPKLIMVMGISEGMINHPGKEPKEGIELVVLYAEDGERPSVDNMLGQSFMMLKSDLSGFIERLQDFV